MRKLLSIGAATAIAICAASTASHATTVTSTWTGTVRAGDDTGGYFGGSLPAGTAFTLTSTFTTPPGHYSSFGPGDRIIGGGTATLTINGDDYTFNQTPDSYRLNQYGSIQMFLGDVSGTFLSFSFYALNPPSSILNSISEDCYADTYCSGTFEIVDGGHFSGAVLDAEHLTVSATATTPIPAALPLLLSALGGLGFAGSRKRRVAA